jgi:hypothetical protein
MNDGGGVNGRVSSGDSFFGLLRTRLMPWAVYRITEGSRPMCLMWSANAVRISCELLGAGSVAYESSSACGPASRSMPRASRLADATPSASAW